MEEIGENLIGQPHKIKKLISYQRFFFFFVGRYMYFA